MKSVQPDQRVVGRAEQIRPDSKSLSDQAVPFEPGASEKDGSQGQRDEPPNPERKKLSAFKSALGKVNRQAAGQQTDGGEDGQFEHLSRRRPGEALPQIEKIGDYKDGEDSPLRHDQADHSDPSSRRKRPWCFHHRQGNGRCAQGQSSFVFPIRPHSYFQSGSSGCLMSHSGRRLCTTGRIGEVVNRRRRGGRPLQRPGVPRIVPGRPCLGNSDQIKLQTKNRSTRPG